MQKTENGCYVIIKEKELIGGDDMSFKNLIDNLTCEEKNNFDYYSQIRGVQQYKIIYETLEKIAPGEITYKDVNSFVRYDKAIKDVLYKYLGTLEEYIKTYIFANYDFKKEAKLTKKEYIFFNQLQALIEKKTVSLDEVSELYKRYRLNFKDMVDLLKEFERNGKFVPDELYLIKDLRNNVMHHSPLLFNINGAEKVNETKKLITLLIKHLPLDYPKYIAEDINDKTKHIKNNINEKLYSVLLCEF